MSVIRLVLRINVDGKPALPSGFWISWKLLLTGRLSSSDSNMVRTRWVAWQECTPDRDRKSTSDSNCPVRKATRKYSTDCELAEK